MNSVVGLISVVIGMFVGMHLYQLPFRLYYQHAAWITEEEFLAVHPKKRWIIWALYGLMIFGFTLFAVVMGSTANLHKGINPFFFFPVFFCCMGAVPAVPELFAKVGVMIPVGQNSKIPVQYTLSPNAPWAGVLRLTLAAVVVGVFVWAR